LIADEPTTALDVTIQAQILELIKDLQKDMGMSVILITHDLGVIAETSQSVIVMYAGKVAEKGSVYDIFDNPSHPYTQGLLASIPRLETEPKSKLSIIEGMVPGLLDLPAGCRFENRCPYARQSCTQFPPPLEAVAEQHQVSCFQWSNIKQELQDSG
jgi:peptide/nickel transport system ATP-binding protein